LIAKLLLALLIILNIYVLATVSKTSRQDIGNNIKLMPSRVKGLFKRLQHDDDKELVTEPSIQPRQAVKMDFLDQCRKNGVICDEGKQSLNCYREVKYSKSRCMTCECSICVHGKCPPATRGMK
jgi:hypothetical protein